jgi:hypothetical protein
MGESAVVLLSTVVSSFPVALRSLRKGIKEVGLDEELKDRNSSLK